MSHGLDARAPVAKDPVHVGGATHQSVDLTRTLQRHQVEGLPKLADVDRVASSIWRHSRTVDPIGERKIGLGVELLALAGLDAFPDVLEARHETRLRLGAPS